MRRVLIPLDLPPAMRMPEALDVYALHGETMGTTWSIKLVAPPRHALALVRESIERVLDRIVAQMSTWIADSDISRFNRAGPGTWHELPAGFYEVLQYALTVSDDTDGAFDPAVGALVDLWGFGPRGRRAECPGDAAINHARVQCRRLKLASGRRALQPGGMQLDLSGVAKGFAVDCVAQRLDRLGIADHLVEIGGELRGTGVKPDGTPWWVALEGSQSCADMMPETVVALHGFSVATSGDAVRHFEIDGRHYSHTIDPRIGYPIPHRMAAVTVLHRRCMCADALATALAVLGPEAGFEHAATHGIAARFIVRCPDGPQERITPAYSAMLG